MGQLFEMLAQYQPQVVQTFAGYIAQEAKCLYNSREDLTLGGSMKKSVELKSKKLRLNRETLLGLEQSDLAFVGGAVTTISCDLGGSCNGCNTRNTCTSRYC